MSPVVLAPVSTAYCSLSRAPPPVSVMYQPVGSVVFVVLPAVLERVLKVSMTADPMVVRDTLPVPVSAEIRRARRVTRDITEKRTTTSIMDEVSHQRLND